MSSALLKDFDVLSRQEQQEALALLDRYKRLEKQDSCQNDIISFDKSQWPDFIEGRHHKIIGEKFNKIAEGKLKRLIVCLPPRHTKSEFASTFFPAWMMGLRGNLKIIQTTHTAELAVRFGRRVRNIIDSDEYQEVFPDIKLQADNKSAGRWTTNKGGESFYSGVGGAITGRGADLLIIDDPVSEQDALSPTAMDAVYEWYTSGPRQRLQPGGTIVIVMTRWSTKDLVGKVLKKQGDDHADQWELVEFPAIMPESEEPLWPEFWKKEELLSVKASLPIMCLPISMSFKAMTRLFQEKKQQTTQRSLRGLCSNQKTAILTKSFFWMQSECGLTFLNLKKWRGKSTSIGSQTVCLSKQKHQAHH
jgi:hypothetical protein